MEPLQEKFYQIYEKVAIISQKEDFQEERQIAKNFYSIQRGFPPDDDPTFLSRANDFIDYFIFDFRMAPHGQSPFEAFLEEQKKSSLQLHQLYQYESLRSSRSSLFEVKKKHEDLLTLFDLMNQRSLQAHLAPFSRSFTYLETGQLIVARLFVFENQVFLSPGLTTQPLEAKSSILKLLKHYQKFQLSFEIPNVKQPQKSIEQILQDRLHHFQKVSEKNQTEKFKISDKIQQKKQMRQFAKCYINEDYILKGWNTCNYNPFIKETSLLTVHLFLDFLMRHELKHRTYKHLNPSLLYHHDQKNLFCFLFSS